VAEQAGENDMLFTPVNHRQLLAADRHHRDIAAFRVDERQSHGVRRVFLV
jgi:hypothetical protein